MNKKEMKKVFKLFPGNSGFTMIELLMTMAIIGVLAASLMIIINPAEMRRRARDSKRISDIGVIKSAVDLALADGQVLAATGASGNTLGSNVDNFANIGMKVGKYLPNIPSDPSSGGSSHIVTSCSPQASSSGTPQYLFWSDGKTYLIRSNMESYTSCSTVINDGNPANVTYEEGTEPNRSKF